MSNINVSKSEELDLLLSRPMDDDIFDECLEGIAEFLLYGDMLDWKTKKLTTLSIYNDIPLECEAENCPYASRCPVLKALPKREWPALVGTRCRVERAYVLNSLTELIRDLNIRPQDSSDLVNLASLIRLMVLDRRIDLQIAMDGIMISDPAFANQRTGEVTNRQIVHPLIKEKTFIQKQVQQIQSALVASRRDRLSTMNQMKNSNSVLNKLLEYGAKLSLEKQNVIEGDFVTIEEEKEE
jgi:hypothetical protein